MNTKRTRAVGNKVGTRFGNGLFDGLAQGRDDGHVNVTKVEEGFNLALFAATQVNNELMGEVGVGHAHASVVGEENDGVHPSDAQNGAGCSVSEFDEVSFVKFVGCL